VVEHRYRSAVAGILRAKALLPAFLPQDPVQARAKGGVHVGDGQEQDRQEEARQHDTHQDARGRLHHQGHSNSKSKRNTDWCKTPSMGPSVGGGGRGQSRKRAQGLGAMLDARVRAVVEGIRADLLLHASTVGRDLSHAVLSSVQVNKGVQLLVRLDQVEQAHQVFLAPRSLAVMQAIDECRNIQVAGKEARRVIVAEVCSGVFSAILQTVDDWHSTLGSAPRHRSSIMCWCVDLVTAFVRRFGTQVCATGELGEVGSAMQTAQDYSNELRKKGISLDFVVNAQLMRPVANMLGALWASVSTAVTQAVMKEGWVACSYSIANSNRLSRPLHRDSTATSPVSPCVPGGAGEHKYKHEGGQEYISGSLQELWVKTRELVMQARGELGAVFVLPAMRCLMVRHMHSVAEGYVDELSHAFVRVDTTQQLTILGNLACLSHTLLPLLFQLTCSTHSGDWKGKYGKSPPRLPNSSPSPAQATASTSPVPVSQRILSGGHRLQEAFLESTLQHATQVLQWPRVDYSTSKRQGEGATPSIRLQKLFAHVGGMGQQVTRHLGADTASVYVAHVLARVILDLVLSQAFWLRFLPPGLLCRMPLLSHMPLTQASHTSLSHMALTHGSHTWLRLLRRCLVQHASHTCLFASHTHVVGSDACEVYLMCLASHMSASRAVSRATCEVPARHPHIRLPWHPYGISPSHAYLSCMRASFSVSVYLSSATCLAVMCGCM